MSLVESLFLPDSHSPKFCVATTSQCRQVVCIDIVQLMDGTCGTCSLMLHTAGYTDHRDGLDWWMVTTSCGVRTHMTLMQHCTVKAWGFVCDIELLVPHSMGLVTALLIGQGQL
jgi:hypothetical protein